MDPSYNTQARVIVTRPVAQSDRLSALISKAGGQAIRVPALEIRSTDDPDAAEIVFASIDQYQTVIFISPNAVRHSLQFVKPDALESAQCLAIGASTAQAMTQAGIHCDAFPADSFTSEALLTLPELEDVQHSSILIVRGTGGRALLGNVLQDRGANIDYAEVYQRQVPLQSADQLNAILANNQADVVMANSGETLANLLSMVDPSQRDALCDLQLITGSARVAQAAVSAGFKHPPLVAKAPDDHSLMSVISNWSAPTSDTVDTTATSNSDSTVTSPEESQDANNAEQNDTQADDNSATNESIQDVHSAPLEHDAPKEIAMKHESNDNPSAESKDDSATDTSTDSPTSTDAQDDIQAEVQADENQSSHEGDGAESDISVAPAVAAAAPVVKRSGAGVAWLALLTALLAAAGTAWNWWQSQSAGTVEQAAFDVASLDIPSRDDIRQQVQELSRSQSGQVTQKLAQQADRIEDALDKQSNLASQVRTQKRSVENLTDELTQMSDSISAMRGVSASVRNTWVRAETEYFLQTANTRLQLAGDVKSAIQALKAADERIVALGDPSLTPVRAQLSEDLLALESLPQLDIEGIALSLNSLAGRITKLPLRDLTPLNFESDASDKASPSDDAGAWTKVKAAFSDMAGGFVRVSPADDTGAVLLAPEQAYFLYRNLELQLQAARVAALQGKQATFNNSIESSKAWLEKYFDLEDTGVATILERMNDLQKQTVTLELPDISKSLNLIRAVVPVKRTSGPSAAATSQSQTTLTPTSVSPATNSTSSDAQDNDAPATPQNEVASEEPQS